MVTIPNLRNGFKQIKKALNFSAFFIYRLLRLPCLADVGAP
jgi:hypothetical protein